MYFFYIISIGISTEGNTFSEEYLKGIGNMIAVMRNLTSLYIKFGYNSNS